MNSPRRLTKALLYTVAILLLAHGTIFAGFLHNPSPITGSGAANRLAYWSSATALTSSADGTFDGLTLRLPDGTESAPSGSYVSDTDLGRYRIGADNEGFTAGGTLRWDYNTTRILSTLVSQAPSGTATAPSYSFSADTGVGMFRSAASTARLVGNTISLQTDTNNFNSHDIRLGTSSTAADLFFLAATESVGATSGTQRGTILESAFNPASGTPTDVGTVVLTTINWGGTPGAGSYEALRISVIETAIPTGTNWLWRALDGASGATFQAGVTNDPWYVAAETTTDPGTGPLTSLNTFAVYMKSDKFVIAYNNAGTITYLRIALDGTATTWVHNTTAP